MAGLDFVLVLQVVFFVFMMWGVGRLFKVIHAPVILGQLAAGIIFGPQLLDMVPYASDGMCATDVREDPYGDYVNSEYYDGCAHSSSAASMSNFTGRRLASDVGHQCDHFTWNRWEEGSHIISIWQARLGPLRRSPPALSLAPSHAPPPIPRDRARRTPPRARGSSWATLASR